MADKPSSYIGEDGRWHHSMRQSWLNQYAHCPEQARLELKHELPRLGTDAAVFGTCTHKVIERKLADPATNVVAAWNDEWEKAINDELVNPDGSPDVIDSWVQMDPSTAQRWGQDIVTRWEACVYPRLLPREVEHKFAVVIHEDDQRVITCKGTIDLIDDGIPDLVDWKTGGREYEPWKFRRYAIQPTQYLMAAVAEELIDPTKDEWTFTYIVFLKGKDVHQELPIVRNRNHFEWLRQKCVTLAMQIEADLPQWALGDTDWWCSPKWCPAWDKCKGALLDE